RALRPDRFRAERAPRDRDHTPIPLMNDRYDALIGLADALAAATDPVAVFRAAHDGTAAVLPMDSFLGARIEGREVRPVVSEGRALGCEAFCAGALDRLAAGRAAPGVRLEGGGFFLAAPLVRTGRLLGCIATGRTGGAPYDAADTAFLETVARFAGAALDSVLASALAQRDREEFERLDAAARDIGASLELDDVAERLAGHAHALVGAPVAVWLVEGERARVVAHGGGARVRRGETRALPPAVAAQLLARKGSWYEEAAGGAERAAPSVAGNGARDADPRAAGVGATRVTVPLARGERLIGFLSAGPTADAAPDEDRLRLLNRLAPHAAAAIENARLHAQVNRLSLTDPLVGLPNRRQFDLFLEREFAAAARGRTLCIALLDLDRFEAYNARNGHRAGDAALIRFADLLRRETRAMNLVARYRGAEFAVILSGGDVSAAQHLIERVRRRLRHEFQEPWTISAGIAEYRPEMKSPVDLVVAADRALCRATAEGPDRIGVAEPLDVPG
ncbi:MAG TPA: diguanylate cyclase, partial [Longimicrobiales bacterium]